MAQLNAVLDQRMKKKNESATSKMAAMAQQSATGNLTSFAGMFHVHELNENEVKAIEHILKQYGEEGENHLQKDLDALISITSEVKAINNQAALLHGERIKKAHDILIHYREGAFTAWLMATYGNRQTPYNLMQYYEFYTAIPRDLRPQLEIMPRQAVYTLASRAGEMEKKTIIVKNYKGENKTEMIRLIREIFPLDVQDKRQSKIGDSIILSLVRLSRQMRDLPTKLSAGQKKQIKDLLQGIQELVNDL